MTGIFIVTVVSSGRRIGAVDKTHVSVRTLSTGRKTIIRTGRGFARSRRRGRFRRAYHRVPPNDLRSRARPTPAAASLRPGPFTAPFRLLRSAAVISARSSAVSRVSSGPTADWQSINYTRNWISTDLIGSSKQLLLSRTKTGLAHLPRRFSVFCFVRKTWPFQWSAGTKTRIEPVPGHWKHRSSFPVYYNISMFLFSVFDVPTDPTRRIVFRKRIRTPCEVCYRERLSVICNLFRLKISNSFGISQSYI